MVVVTRKQINLWSEARTLSWRARRRRGPRRAVNGVSEPQANYYDVEITHPNLRIGSNDML